MLIIKYDILKYYLLLQFIGFKNKPSQQEQLADPLNNFTVKGNIMMMFALAMLIMMTMMPVHDNSTDNNDDYSSS